MAYLIVRHEVEDYDDWKTAFDDHADIRDEYGSLGGFVGRVADEPDVVAAVIEWDSLDHAREFADSDTLRDAMRDAGVAGEPAMTLLDDTETFEH